MKRVYACDISKKKELLSVIESDPYSEDSFSRVGYVIRDGSSIGESSDAVYLYISAQEPVIKKLDAKLRGIAEILEGEEADRIIKKIEDEGESAAQGVGSIFG